MKLEWSPEALKDLSRLPKIAGRRILAKMEWFMAQEKPLSYAKKLKNSHLGTHRFRVGNYRILIELRGDRLHILLVVAVLDRKEAYQL